MRSKHLIACAACSDGEILRIACLLLALIIPIQVRAADQQANAASTSTLEQFKSFISNPPPIERLIYRVTLPANPSRPDLGVARSRYFQEFFAAWQSNSWFVRQVRPDDDLKSFVLRGQSIFGNRDLYWLLEPGTATRWFDDDPRVEGVKIDLPTTSPNRTKGVRELRGRSLFELLNMGVLNIKPGTIRWEGNRFRVDHAERKQKIEGELFASADGLPSYMRVSYTEGTNKVDFVSRYTYEQNAGLPYLPSRVQTFRLELGDDHGREKRSFTILSMRPSPVPLPEVVFDPGPIIASNRLALRFYTNGAMYQLNEYGEFVLAKENAPGKVRTHNRSGFFLIASLTTAAFFVLMVRTKRSEKQPSTSKRMEIQ